MSSHRKPPHHYVAYIDESGDDGLNLVKPVDSNGASEWFILGAMVISAARERQVQTWHQQALKLLGSKQLKEIHFVKLNNARKSTICSYLATLPARYFVLASNKKNMKGYINPFADKIPSKNWFYCWLTRLLLERITNFVHTHSISTYGEAKYLKLQYSNRGGLSIAQMNAYYEWLKYKGSAGRQFLPLGDLKHEVLHRDLIEVFNQKDKLGLQFGDVVASSFLKSCDVYTSGGCDPYFAKLLRPRMARSPDKTSGKIAGYGVKLMPNLKDAKLRPDQQAIFSYYGYPNQWWAPAPSDPIADSLTV